MAVRLEPELRAALDHEAARRGVRRSALIRDALLRVVDHEVLDRVAEEERDRALLAYVTELIEARSRLAVTGGTSWARAA